jgi:hypothetical protein
LITDDLRGFPYVDLFPHGIFSGLRSFVFPETDCEVSFLLKLPPCVHQLFVIEKKKGSQK